MHKGELRPYEFQVGGHHTNTDEAPVSLKDDKGRFYKKLQAGDRSAREVAFYQTIEQHRLMNDNKTGVDAEPHLHGGPCSNPQQHKHMLELAQWVPKSCELDTLVSNTCRPDGTMHMDGADYLLLQDIAADYKQPCVMDIKVGFCTWYPWASPDQQKKYKEKDESTTQSSLGFRVCGMLVHNPKSRDSWRGDRHWGKTLNDDNVVTEAFHKFADNGYLNLLGLLTGPGMLLEQLQQLSDLFSRQQCWHFYSASLLLVYEGAAQTAADARLVVKLIDFAHSFSAAANDGQMQKSGSVTRPGPSGIDQNFLDGLNSLLAVLQKQATGT